MMRSFSFRHDASGASSAEFALILPAFLLFLLGTIDAARWAWTLNEIEKATQEGARFAVVNDLVADGLNTADFTDACGEGALNVGDRICEEAFPDIVCDLDSCDCSGGTCGPVPDSHNPDAFGAILGAMRRQAPYVAAAQVSVTYSPSGIGYLGDPACLGTRDRDGCSTGELSDVAPLVTVRVASLRFQPITFSLFGGDITLPARSYTLTLEDGFSRIEP